MNCSHAERLFDAFLDRQLSGTLRLELDAHRLRCRQCQQTLAMLESCGEVIASDRRGPALSDDFAERVMAEVSEQQASRLKIYRFRATRVAAVVGTLIPAAAVLAIAVIMSSPDPSAPVDNGASTPLIAKRAVDVRGGFDIFFERFREGIRAAKILTDSTRRTARYLNMEVDGAVAAASARQNTPGFLGLLESMLSVPPTDSGEPENEGSAHFSL